MQNPLITKCKKLEHLTRKWWFLLVVTILFFLPPFAARSVQQQEIQDVIKTVLSNPLVLRYPFLLVISKVTIITMLVGIALFGSKITRLFNAVVTVLYFTIAVFQNIAITDEYGFVALTGNMLLILIVALLWMKETFTGENDFSQVKIGCSKWWVTPLALLAFWYPVNTRTMLSEFSFANLLGNEAMLTFCMFTPVVLSVLLYFYPHANRPTMRVTSYVGLLFGITNMISWFVLDNSMWWMGILHLPLMIISAYTFSLSMKS